MSKTRLRIHFTKQGDLRWLGHRDLARVWERLLRRADLQLAFSEGFHPKPRISFPSALALGIEALNEVVELEIVGEFSLDDIEGRIREQMPDGMELLSLQSPQYKLGKAKVESAEYCVEIDPAQQPALTKRIDEVLALPLIEVQRDEKKTITCETNSEHFSLRLEDGKLHFALPVTDGATLRPSELLEHIGLGDLLESGATLVRTQVVLRPPEPKPEPKNDSQSTKTNPSRDGDSDSATVPAESTQNNASPTPGDG